MRLAIVFLLLTLTAILTGNAEGRNSRKCPGCRRHDRVPRKGREGRRKTRRLENLERSKPQLDSPMLGNPLISEPELAKYLEEFMKSPKFLQGRRPSPREVNKYPTDHYTEAIVDAVTKHGGRVLPILKVVGKFGHHSRHQNVFGRLVHIMDSGRNGSHYGCSGDIGNKGIISSRDEPWVALMARGKCNFLVKIKLAERFNASAVVVYDTETREVEVMRTIGTRVPSLMIDLKSGNRLSSLASGDLSVYLNISVGKIYIQATSENRSAGAKSKKKAIVDMQIKSGNFLPASLHKTTGCFGLNSPKRSIFGKMIHVKDFGDVNSHFGCSGRVSNEEEVANVKDNWIALIARGSCNSVVKVKLAERYSASAVVIYDTKVEETDTIDVIGANITAISIDIIDGRKALELLKEEKDLYIDIKTDSSQCGSAGSLRPSLVFVVVSLLSLVCVNISIL